MEVIPEGARSRSHSASVVPPSPQTPKSVPSTRVEKVADNDADTPRARHGEIPGTLAHEKRKADAAPDSVVMGSETADDDGNALPQRVPLQRELSTNSTSTAIPVNGHDEQGIHDVSEHNIGVNNGGNDNGQEPMDDDFDDFTQGQEGTGDDDFGDFDDGFQEPQAPEESPPPTLATPGSTVSNYEKKKKKKKKRTAST